MGWLFGKSKPEPEPETKKVDISDLQAWYGRTFGRPKSDILREAGDAHKEIVNAFFNIDASVSKIKPKEVEDKRISKIIEKERENITKKTKSIVRAFTSKPFKPQKTEIEQIYSDGRATLSSLFSPKQTWLLGKYFTVDTKLFMAAQEAINKLGDIISKDMKRLENFGSIENLINEIADIEKIISQKQDEKKSIESRIEQIKSEILKLEAEIQKIRGNKEWSAAQSIVEKARQIRMESNHVKSIIASKKALAEKILQKGRKAEGIGPEQAAHLAKLENEIDYFKKRLSEIEEPEIPEIVETEAKISEQTTDAKARLDKQMAALEKTKVELSKTEHDMKENIRTIENLAAQDGKRILICQ